VEPIHFCEYRCATLTENMTSVLLDRQPSGVPVAALEGGVFAGDAVRLEGSFFPGAQFAQFRPAGTPVRFSRRGHGSHSCDTYYRCHDRGTKTYILGRHILHPFLVPITASPEHL